MTDTHKVEIVTIDPREIAAPGQRMHPLVHAAVQGGALDPATLRELLAVQREYEAGEAKKAFTRAKAALKRDLPSVVAKDATVDYTSAKGRTYYKHASLAGVMDAITEPLTAHGFALSWEPSIGERVVRVTCRLTHAEGHHEECSLEAPADNSGNKSPAQAIASTITLLQRYTALALLGIATADMPEPTGEERAAGPGPDYVDAGRNLRAAAAIEKAGRSRAAAEEHVGRPVSQWTAADLAVLREWLRAPAPQDDPGDGGES